MATWREIDDKLKDLERHFADLADREITDLEQAADVVREVAHCALAFTRCVREKFA